MPMPAMTYDQWLEKAGIWGASPEVSYSNDAWNAAIEAAQAKLVASGNGLLAEVIADLDTRFRANHD